MLCKKKKKKKNKGKLFWGKRTLFQIVPFCCEPGSCEQFLEKREEEEEAFFQMLFVSCS